MNKFSHHSIPVYSILSGSYGELGKLYQHSGLLQELQHSLASYLDNNMRQHCRAANYANNTLTLHTDSPARAAKLRFMTPDIVQHMRGNPHLNHLKAIRIRVALPEPEAQATATQHLSMSQSAADHLKKVALSMEDEALRNCLLRLSEHQKP